MVKLKKKFAKFMIPIDFVSEVSEFISSVEASNIARCSSKSDELRNMNSIIMM